LNAPKPSGLDLTPPAPDAGPAASGAIGVTRIKKEMRSDVKTLALLILWRG